jgi:hypothetical protein
MSGRPPSCCVRWPPRFTEELRDTMNDVIFIIYVVLFWAALFVFAFWLSVRALRVPTDAELEHAAEEAEAVHSTH